MGKSQNIDAKNEIFASCQNKGIVDDLLIENTRRFDKKIFRKYNNKDYTSKVPEPVLSKLNTDDGSQALQKYRLLTDRIKFVFEKELSPNM